MRLPFFLRRGMVYVDGTPLRQVELYSHLSRETGTYWVEENGLKVHFRMPDNGSPEGHLMIRMVPFFFCTRTQGDV